jgi:hypothetical protein
MAKGIVNSCENSLAEGRTTDLIKSAVKLVWEKNGVERLAPASSITVRAAMSNPEPIKKV